MTTEYNTWNGPEADRVARDNAKYFKNAAKMRAAESKPKVTVTKKGDTYTGKSDKFTVKIGAQRRTTSTGYMPKQPIAYGYGYKDPMRKNEKGELIGGKRYEYPIHTKEDLAHVKKNGYEHRLAGQKDPGPKDYSKQKAAAIAAEKAIPKAWEKK